MMVRKKDSKMSLLLVKVKSSLSFITNAFFSQNTNNKGLRTMIRTTTMKRQHVLLLNEMIVLRSEKVFFLLSVSLSLSFKLCFQQNSSSSFYEVFV